MKERFEDAPESVTDLCRKVRREYFPELRNVAIKFLFDLKKSLHQGQVKIACIMRPNDLLRHFASKEDTQYDGYDYILILDKACWDNVSEEDQERMLRHELRHCWFDIESDKDPYKLVDHEITDFYAEVELTSLIQNGGKGWLRLPWLFTRRGRTRRRTKGVGPPRYTRCRT